MNFEFAFVSLLPKQTNRGAVAEPPHRYLQGTSNLFGSQVFILFICLVYYNGRSSYLDRIHSLYS